MKAQEPSLSQPFASAMAQFTSMCDHLQGEMARVQTHDQVEEWLHGEGIELMRQLMQGYLHLRSPEEPETVPVGADGIPRTHRRVDSRGLMTIFGDVEVRRSRYSARGAGSLAVLDGALNLPSEKYSLGLRRRFALEAARASYDEAVEAIAANTGARVGKRQAEELAVRSAQDFESFYTAREPQENTFSSGILVISVDGKGIVMRPEALRAETQAAAKARRHKHQHRLSKGEKRSTRRMATVAAVYTIAPFVREPVDIVSHLAGAPEPDRPKPEHKRVWASVKRQPRAVIAQAFDEAERRDPRHTKRWVALVDGNKHQIRVLRQEAERRGIALTIILDIIHVTERLWDAAHVLHDEGDPKAEAWVSQRLCLILWGRAGAVAGGIRRSATLRGLTAAERKPMDACANYLLTYKSYLAYDQALALGLPIATGVIEGACRYLVKDRMDRTGARWGLHGAEAVLRLRALRASGDFDAYWRFHVECEQERNHRVHYADATVPVLRPTQLLQGNASPLRLVA